MDASRTTGPFRTTGAPVEAAQTNTLACGAERDAARRALEQTQEARKSGEIVKAGQRALLALEASLAGIPDEAEPGTVVARVVASSDRRTGVPAVPLEGLIVRLRTGEREIAESTTDRVGIVTLPFESKKDVGYELEVLAPNGTVIARQPGKAGDGTTKPHLVEVPRSDLLKPQLERAVPFENAIRQARERATLAEQVMTKALAEQERRLVDYIAALDADAGGKPPQPGGEVTPPKEPPPGGGTPPDVGRPEPSKPPSPEPPPVVPTRPPVTPGPTKPPSPGGPPVIITRPPVGPQKPDEQTAPPPKPEKPPRAPRKPRKSAPKPSRKRGGERKS